MTIHSLPPILLYNTIVCNSNFKNLLGIFSNFFKILETSSSFFEFKKSESTHLYSQISISFFSQTCFSPHEIKLFILYRLTDSPTKLSPSFSSNQDCELVSQLPIIINSSTNKHLVLIYRQYSRLFHYHLAGSPTKLNPSYLQPCWVVKMRTSFGHEVCRYFKAFCCFMNIIKTYL